MFSRVQSYKIPDGIGNLAVTTIVFFGSRDEEFCSNLTRHAKDHFLKQRWPRVLQLDEKKIGELRQKAASVGVTAEREVANELWPALGPILDNGIRYSVELPVLLRYEQDREAQGRVVEQNVVGFYFLAREGFIVVVHSGRLRTAYFRSDLPDADMQSVFDEAWNYLRRKLQLYQRDRARFAPDPKHGQNYAYTGMQAISLANWTTCPRI